MKKKKRSAALAWGEGSMFQRGPKLCFKFRYFGKPVVISTALTATPGNKNRALDYLVGCRTKMWMVQILQALRPIDTCENYRWKLPDPFRKVRQQMAQLDRVEKRLLDVGEILPHGLTTLRFDEYMTFLDNLNPWYRPVAKLGVIIGMTLSEMAGLKMTYIKDAYLYIRRSVTGEESTLMHRHRSWEIRIRAGPRRFFVRTGWGQPIVVIEIG